MKNIQSVVISTKVRALGATCNPGAPMYATYEPAGAGISPVARVNNFSSSCTALTPPFLHPHTTLGSLHCTVQQNI
jgi:hypothetical protein